MLACETLKPLIDAGTDEGLWPDDDPAHRVMTCYLRDPRPLPGGHATINIWVVPLGEYDDPTCGCCDACRARRRRSYPCPFPIRTG